MVEVTEDDKNIYIKMSKRADVDLERVYNKNYFFSLGIDLIEPEKKGGEKKGKFVETLDKSEKAIDDTGSAISKNVGTVAETILTKTESFLERSGDFNLNGTLEFTIEKTGSESHVKTLISYLEMLKTSSELNPLTTFVGTAIDYLILENLTNDLSSCVEYVKAYGMQLLKKNKDMVYVINGRFLFLTEEIIIFDEKLETEEESLLKLLSEVCSIDYVRGEDHFKNIIYGTHLYFKLKSLLV